MSATTHHNHFTTLFPGPHGWASARRELLDFMVQGKINRGKHTDQPAGRHYIRTHGVNLCTYFNDIWHFYLSRTTQVSRYRKKHSPTHHTDLHPIFISFFHLLQSIASSLFNLCAWQSFCTTSVQVLFGLPRGLEPSTSYSIDRKSMKPA